MRTLGLDLGSVTLGISVSDTLGMIARPVETVRFESDNYDQAFERVKPYIEEFKPERIVLGLPRHMNGDIGIRGNISIDFKEKLETLNIEVVLWDERLTTVAANRILIAGDVSRKKRKKIIDQMAAVQILQSYLDSRY